MGGLGTTEQFSNDVGIFNHHTPQKIYQSFLFSHFWDFHNVFTYPWRYLTFVTARSEFEWCVKDTASDMLYYLTPADFLFCLQHVQLMSCSRFRLTRSSCRPSPRYPQHQCQRRHHHRCRAGIRSPSSTPGLRSDASS